MRGQDDVGAAIGRRQPFDARDAAALAAAVVRRPVTLAALTVLVLNDHLLKARWPGTVTGKLSDLVWPLVAVPLVGLLLAPAAAAIGRRRWALAATVLAATPFAVVNLSPGAADVAARLLTSVVGPSSVTPDPSDLLALPVLLLPLRQLRRLPIPDRRPAGALGAFQLAVLGLAALGTAATSCDDPRPRIGQLGVDRDGHLIASLGAAGHLPDEIIRSEDAGETWQVVEDPRASPDDRPDPRHEALRRQLGDREDAPERCAERTCYRLESESVTVTRGGDTDRIALIDPGRQPAERRYLYGDACAIGGPRARDLELVEGPSGGHRVVVSRDLEGVTLIDDGEVRHVGVLGAEPVAEAGLRFSMIAPEIAVVSFLAAFAWLTASAVWWSALDRHARVGSGRRGGAYMLATVGVLGALVLWYVAALVDAIGGGSVLAAAIVAGAVAIGWVIVGVPPGHHTIPLGVAARVLGPTLAAAGAIVAWGTALLPSYQVMLVVATVLAAVAAEATRRLTPLPPLPLPRTETDP